MSGWQVGDLALCIKQGEWIEDEIGCLTSGPRAGEVCTVSEVVPYQGDVFLAFVEWPCEEMYWDVRFRKVTPGTDVKGVEERRRIPVGEPA